MDSIWINPGKVKTSHLLREGEATHQRRGKLFVEAGESICQGKDKAVVKGGKTAIH